MIVYEVRLTMAVGLADEYQGWLGPHIREILAIPGFRYAELHREDEPADRCTLVVRYHLESREALELYLAEHAARLRAEGLARFGDRVVASRRVTELVERYDAG